MLLNRRLKLLKADEQSLRATISELVTATEIAERAIGGLKLTVHECDMGLGERLAQAPSASPSRSIAPSSPARICSSRLAQIVTAGQGEPSSPRRRSPNCGSAQMRKPSPRQREAFAERLRTKVHGLAA